MRSVGNVQLSSCRWANYGKLLRDLVRYSGLNPRNYNERTMVFVEADAWSYSCIWRIICARIATGDSTFRRAIRQTSLQSIIPKDVMTSLLSVLTSSRRKICVQFSTGFCQKKTPSTSNLWKTYRELCIDAQNPSKSFQNKSHSVLFQDKTN
jgi:hypothetical protein